jgi:hypothetical protein
MVCCLGLAADRAEGTAADEDAKVISKEVTGEVVYVGKRAISVEFDRTADGSMEMLIPIDGNTMAKHLQTLAQLKRGDRVRVLYQQTYKEDEQGERVILKTVATTVALVRRAVPEGTLRSEDSVSVE